MSKTYTVTFDHFSDVLGVIPVTCELERRSGGYVVMSIDATNHSGGELSEYTKKCIEEKAISRCHDEHGDVSGDDEAERARDAADDRRMGL